MATYSPSNPVWIDYLILTFPADMIPNLNWAQAKFNKFGSDVDMDLTSLTPTLSDDGQAPATHYMIGVLVDAAMKTDSQALYDAASPPVRNKIGLYWESDGWSISTALADAGLAQVPSGI